MYIKTKQEQKLHAKMLQIVYAILQKHKITTLLTGSALLGIYRDRELRPNCMGIVLTAFYDEIKPKENDLIRDFKKSGLKISKHFKNRNFKIRVKKGKLNIEICGYSKAAHYYYRQLSNKKKIIPIKLLEKPYNDLIFQGIKYQTPKNIEKYLEFIYNDWKTPVGGRPSPSTYKTSKHMVII